MSTNTRPLIGFRAFRISLFASCCLQPTVSLAIVFSTLDVPGSDGTSALGIDGNNIVGVYNVGAAEHGFLYDGTNFTTLDVPAALGSNTNARGISGSTIAGFYTDSSGVFHGFTFDGFGYTPLDNPDAGSAAGQGTRAFGIDGNKIVGDFLHPAGLEQGYVFDGSSFTTFAPGPTVQTVAFGVQGSTVVGTSADTSLHGLIFNGTTYSTLDDPAGGAGPGQGTQIFDLDGQKMVGRYLDSSNARHGFYFDGTNFQTIDYPGSTASLAAGITGNTIVGAYTDAQNVQHGFIAIVPEPTPFWLLLLAITSLIGLHARRSKARGPLDYASVRDPGPRPGLSCSTPLASGILQQLLPCATVSARRSQWDEALK